MKLLSNFDTQLKQQLYQESVEQFDTEHVLLIQRSRFFYWTRVWVPMIALLLMIFWAIAALYYFQIREVPILITIGLVLLALLYQAWRGVWPDYVDYSMDFMIVTPQEVMMYDQDGVLHRSSQRIHVRNIKNITTSKTGFLQSLFDLGTITFISELGDHEGQGEISMDMVDVNRIETRVRDILRFNS
jgi:membrane protein YdbS with pleckstrin-like domain